MQGGREPGPDHPITVEPADRRVIVRIGDTILAVDGQAYTPELLKAAIVAAKGTKTPVPLLVRHDDRIAAVALDYHGGLRYPRLEKVGTGETGLDRLLAPR